MVLTINIMSVFTLGVVKSSHRTSDNWENGMQSSLVSMRIKQIFKIYLLAAFAILSFASVPAVAGEVEDWRRKVAQRIAKKHIYPRSALSREIEGKARVKLTMDRSGEITGYEVVQPTGQAILDKAIPKMMKKLNPLPAPPESIPDAKLSFIIPITWRLQ